MSNYNRTEHLKELHSKRKAMTQEKVDKAIQRLIKAQKAINFNSVANESGVTKKTLYDNNDIRERIETLRYQQSQVPTPCLLYTSPSPRDRTRSRMPSSA